MQIMVYLFDNAIKYTEKGSVDMDEIENKSVILLVKYRNSLYQKIRIDSF
jgi:signal transduction histidine kinase